MPEVGYDNKPTRYDLKTVEGGWVELRRLPYDEILKRREMGTKLSMEQATSRGRRRKESNADTQKIGIELAQLITREYEFASCITDHNLTVDGQPVDFSQPKLAFKIVDPRVLQEIEFRLAELNLETDEGELEDFMKSVKPSSLDEEKQPESITETS